WREGPWAQKEVRSFVLLEQLIKKTSTWISDMKAMGMLSPEWVSHKEQQQPQQQDPKPNQNKS
ncbi:GL15777, partial [Drosophila persimilis]